MPDHLGDDMRKTVKNTDTEEDKPFQGKSSIRLLKNFQHFIELCFILHFSFSSKLWYLLALVQEFMNYFIF